MKTYNAQIVHTETTIKTLVRCQDRLCHPILNYIGGAGSVILVILAIMMQPHIGKISTAVFSFLGCWLFVTNRHRPIQQTENVLAKFRGNMPMFRYSFTDSGVIVKRENLQETIPYDQITGLAEDDRFCYFVYQKKAAFMFEKKSVDKLPELKVFLRDKVNRKWVNARRYTKRFL